MADKSKQLTPVQAFRGTLDLMREELKNALPPQIPVDRFIRTTITAIQMNPDLLECDKRTLLSGLMKCAQDGLLPDGREAALVKYRNNKGGFVTAQYLPMVGGLLKKARNSGEIKEILAEAVYERDMFSYELGESPKITHKPYWGEDRGVVEAFYAIVKTKDGGIYRKVLSKSDVDKIKAKSKARDNGPWVDFYEQMGVKTAIKAVLKLCPQSSDLQGLIDYDNEKTGIETEREVKDVTNTVSGEPKDLMRELGLKTGKEMYGENLDGFNPENKKKEPSLDDVMDAEAKEIDSKSR